MGGTKNQGEKNPYFKRWMETENEEYQKTFINQQKSPTRFNPNKMLPLLVRVLSIQ